MPHSSSSGPPRPAIREAQMDVLYPRCCGLDIHKKVVVACRITPGPAAIPHKEIRSFGTTTAAIEDLRRWLAAGGVTHVAMEATGVYWSMP